MGPFWVASCSQACKLSPRCCCPSPAPTKMFSPSPLSLPSWPGVRRACSRKRLVSGSRTMAQKARVSAWPGVIALAIGTAYLIALLTAEKQILIIALLLAGIAVVVAAAWFGMFDSISASFADHEDALRACA